MDTTIKIYSDLIFIKKVPLIQKKIQDYYDSNLVASFNNYLKPQLELWIQTNLLDKIHKKP